MKPFYLSLVLVALLSAPATAQDSTAQNDVVVSVETFVISTVTAENGTPREEAIAATTARPGQVVEYRLRLVNRGEATLPPGTVKLRGPVPDTTSYVAGSATPSSEAVLTEVSADGGETFSQAATAENEAQVYNVIRWTVLIPLEPGQEMQFVYRVTVG